MKNNYKKESAYKSIGEVAKTIGLINKKTGHVQTHTIRYWETQFTQIKPSIKAGRRRYYSLKDLKIINNICTTKNFVKCGLLAFCVGSYKYF